MEPLKEPRSGASTPLRHTGLSSLSRNMSLPKAASVAGSADMRRNIEVLTHAFSPCLHSVIHDHAHAQEKEQELQKLNAARVSVLEVKTKRHRFGRACCAIPSIQKTACCIQHLRFVCWHCPAVSWLEQQAEALSDCQVSTECTGLGARARCCLQEQLQGLEGQVAERDTELERLQEQIVQLTEDFRYNLKVPASALHVQCHTCATQ